MVLEDGMSEKIRTRQSRDSVVRKEEGAKCASEGFECRQKYVRVTVARENGGRRAQSVRALYPQQSPFHSIKSTVQVKRLRKVWNGRSYQRCEIWKEGRNSPF